jgi:uncharacterized membrane protein YphA (DoxX/SURF4 family)
MNIILWILQILLGLYFFGTGIVHFVVPPGLPEPMAWMYDLAPTLHWISGTAEILGGLGLILPAATRIQPRLTPLAAAALALVMVLAMGYHVQRGEMINIGMNVVLGLFLAFIAYGRWKLAPLTDRAAG